MTTRIKCAVFLGLAFAISWPALIGSWLFGHRTLAEGGLLTLVYVAGPGLSAILCAIVFERGRRIDALGLGFRPNVWWLWAILIPLLVTLASIAITSLLSPHRLATMDAMAVELAGTLGHRVDQALSALGGVLAMGLLQNAILCSLTEELGWRGYLYDLLRPCGFWRTALGTGLVWGVWHWPMIYLYGLNYPNYPNAGLVVFPFYTMLSACLLTVVRDRSGSVWAAGIMHGATNTFALLFLLALGDLGWPWGVAGIGGLLALGLAVAAFGVSQRVIKDRSRGPPFTPRGIS